MKNVLLTTTALVAFAGAAAADVSWSGDAFAEYNDIDGIDYEANIDIDASTALNDGVTAGLTWGATLDTDGSLLGDNLPVIYLESGMGKLSAGNADAIGTAFDHVSTTKGLDLKGELFDILGDEFDMPGSLHKLNDDDFMVRGDATVGGFSVSASILTDAEIDAMWPFTNDTALASVGASGDFNGVSFGVAYMQVGEIAGVNANILGANAGFSISGLDLGVSVINLSNWTGYNSNEYGVDASYDVGMGVTLGAYYAYMDSDANGGFTADSYGATVGYAGNGVKVTLGYDLDGWNASGLGQPVTVSDASKFTGDGSFDFGNGFIAYAGFEAPKGGDTAMYVAGTYDLGGGAQAYASYADNADAGPDDWNKGTTVGLSIKF